MSTVINVNRIPLNSRRNQWIALISGTEVLPLPAVSGRTWKQRRLFTVKQFGAEFGHLVLHFAHFGVKSFADWTEFRVQDGEIAQSDGNYVFPGVGHFVLLLDVALYGDWLMNAVKRGTWHRLQQQKRINQWSCRLVFTAARQTVRMNEWTMRRMQMIRCRALNFSTTFDGSKNRNLLNSPDLTTHAAEKASSLPRFLFVKVICP